MQEDWETLVDNWDFSVLDLNRARLNHALQWIWFQSEQSGCLWAVHCDRKRMQNFLQAIEAAYLNNAYHNWQHGVDVCHTVYRFVSVTGGNLALNNHDRFGLLCAAVCHDV